MEKIKELKVDSYLLVIRNP